MTSHQESLLIEVVGQLRSEVREGFRDVRSEMHAGFEQTEKSVDAAIDGLREQQRKAGQEIARRGAQLDALQDDHDKVARAHRRKISGLVRQTTHGQIFDAKVQAQLSMARVLALAVVGLIGTGLGHLISIWFGK